jgi:hypothetical protein
MALWFHITGCTYGAWLPGNDRSFRTRHHREHIEGDHQRPPAPGKYDTRRSWAEEHMRRTGRAPVRLSPKAQRLALDTMIEAIGHRGGAVRIACMDDHHFHILMRLPEASKPTLVKAWVSHQRGDHLPLVRWIVGHAKSRAARALSDAGLVEPGGVWATRMHMRRIIDEAQFRAATAYIGAHAQEPREATVIAASA